MANGARERGWLNLADAAGFRSASRLESSGSPRAPCERPSVSWLKSPREDLVSIYAARPEPAKAAVLAEAGHSGQLPAAAPVPIK